MNPSLVSVSDFISCIYLAIIFLVLIELKYSKKVTFIFIVTFILFAFFTYLKFVSMDFGEGKSSAITLTIPSFILCLLLSKNKDSRFVFTFCTVDIMGLIIIIIARMIAILFNDNSIVILSFTITGLSFLLFVSWKFRKQYIQIQRTLQSGWRSFGSVAVMFYIMIYMIISYPVPIKERREYLPVLIFFSITILFVYVVIYQTVIKSIKIHDEQKDKELLETKIALQNSQLKFKELYYKMAYTDALTGLKNRADFEERKKSLFKNIENGDMISCLSFDLNNLKETNDIYGHDKGDELIKTFADILKRVFNDSQTYRVGGDEFIVVFCGISKVIIEEQIGNLNREIIHINKNNKIQISFAMGLASISEAHIKDINSLIITADKRMYENKNNMKRVL
ncbi:GGDEF domain-containing protein [Anaerovorax sp. IOR16]|uniref:GGDEF domain-containing protein n=1 Tax=Anaerovorax sp. IOR16 TaxID=2773458 RepID=UPI0019D16D33|nr:GGDEF domain-containing protein [Anaerovorax sp. IOR16]